MQSKWRIRFDIEKDCLEEVIFNSGNKAWEFYNFWTKHLKSLPHHHITHIEISRKDGDKEPIIFGQMDFSPVIGAKGEASPVYMVFTLGTYHTDPKKTEIIATSSFKISWETYHNFVKRDAENPNMTCIALSCHIRPASDDDTDVTQRETTLELTVSYHDDHMRGDELALHQIIGIALATAYVHHEKKGEYPLQKENIYAASLDILRGLLMKAVETSNNSFAALYLGALLIMETKIYQKEQPTFPASNRGDPMYYQYLLVHIIKNGNAELLKVVLDHFANQKALSLSDEDGDIIIQRERKALGNNRLTLAPLELFRCEDGLFRIFYQKPLSTFPFVLDMKWSISGLPLLTFAASVGHDRIVAVLLEYGADVNAKGVFGYTALMFAAINGYVAIARWLLKAGAEIGVTSENGETALQKSIEAGNREVASVILTEKLRRKFCC